MAYEQFRTLNGKGIRCVLRLEGARRPHISYRLAGQRDWRTGYGGRINALIDASAELGVIPAAAGWLRTVPRLPGKRPGWPEMSSGAR